MKDEKKERKSIFSRAYRDNPVDAEREDPVLDNPGFANFFKLLKRKFSQILSLNFFLILGNFPIFFALLVLAGYFSHSTSGPAMATFPQLYGAQAVSPSAGALPVLGSFFIQSPVTILSAADYVLLGLSCLTAFTFGPVMVGTTYIMRNIVREEPVFLFHDFFYVIKRNLKQSLIFGFIDVLINYVLINDIISYNLNYSSGGFQVKLMFYLSLCIAVLYFFMRMFIYVMMLTFDLSIFKLLKNSLIFSALGIKRNICAILGAGLVVAFDIFLLKVYFPIGIILPFAIIPSLILFISVYCAYPTIDDYMIKPYYEENG